jgi:hypothetical protein
MDRIDLTEAIFSSNFMVPPNLHQHEHISTDFFSALLIYFIYFSGYSTQLKEEILILFPLFLGGKTFEN